MPQNGCALSAPQHPCPFSWHSFSNNNSSCSDTLPLGTHGAADKWQPPCRHPHLYAGVLPSTWAQGSPLPLEFARDMNFICPVHGEDILGRPDRFLCADCCQILVNLEAVQQVMNTGVVSCLPLDHSSLCSTSCSSSMPGKLGEGSKEALKTGGWGFLGKGLNGRLTNPQAPNVSFGGFQWSIFLALNTRQMMMIFLDPSRALIPKLPFSISSNCVVWMTWDRGLVPVDVGTRQWSPF